MRAPSHFSGALAATSAFVTSTRAQGGIAIDDDLSLSLNASSGDNICCTALEAAGIQNVLYPGSLGYENRTDSYWSVTARLTPYCIAQPISVDEVSLAVTTLVSEPSCEFAVRSGGHMIWAGASNTNNGVTLDLGLMNTTTYNPSTGLASIGAGTRWGPVYEALEAYNVTVPGGRAAQVGIAGFLTGGGNSFYSARKGFACDNVVNFEVVLADGSVINANSTANTDLFQALKGGQSNFGIVTRFDMAAFPAGPLWGGAVTTNVSTGPAQLSAYVNWTASLGTNGNVNSSALTFWQYSPTLNDTVIISGYDNTYGTVDAPELAEFMAVANATPGATVANTMRLASHLDLVLELNQPDGYRDIWWTGTVRNDRRVYDRFIALHDRLVDYMKTASPDGDFITQAMFQAIPTIFSQHGVANGGNVLGLDRLRENVVMLLFTLSVKGEDQQAVAQQQVRALGEATMAYASSVNASVEWEYINYAYEWQSPIQSYGQANVDKIAAAAKKYDPTGVFQTRAKGGFKVSNQNGTAA